MVANCSLDVLFTKKAFISLESLLQVSKRNIHLANVLIHHSNVDEGGCYIRVI
jgi:hypothetical protein